ncbi:MAG: hypothetical protein GQ574_26775 [Crocinitomix sp.]|nr:hypothetical protein [Crocinitomix sp.]
MNEGTAITIAEHKMKELGVGDNYILRYRHFRLDPNEVREIKGENHLYILTYPFNDIKISSKAGVYDLKDDGINELQYVHRGVIRIENKSGVRLDAKFIQAIPLVEERESTSN